MATLTNNARFALVSTLFDTVGVSTVNSTINTQITNGLTTSDGLWSVSTTMDGASDSYDLVGTLTDPLGNAVTFESIEGLFIKNASDLPIVVGGANNIPLLNGSTDKLNLAAGAVFFTFCDIPVTAGTGDLITLTSLVATWGAGTYAKDTLKRYDGVIYKVIAEVETDKEPTVTAGWEDDWEAQDGEAYEVIVIGTQP